MALQIGEDVLRGQKEIARQGYSPGGLERLAEYARRFGRDPSEIETIYRTHQFELKKEPVGTDRLPFVGDAEQIAGDIHRYQDRV